MKIMLNSDGDNRFSENFMYTFVPLGHHFIALMLDY